MAIAEPVSLRRSSFFLGAHGVLLLIVLVGFAPSFYLRATFPHVHQLPVLLHIHGAVLTGWFVLTVVQGWLIRSQRYQVHRRLGYIAAGYAAVVIVLGTLANLRLISEIDSVSDGENIVVWGNFFTLVMFALLLAYDLATRRKPHPASWIGMIAIVASRAGAVFLGVTGIGYHLING